MTLDRDNVTALYAQIAELLKQQIGAGAYEPSGRLPSEQELVQRYGVSRVTVRLALGALEEQRLVERKQGKGTYALGKRIRHGLDTLVSFHQTLKNMGLAARIRFISQQRVALPAALRSHWCEAGSECLSVARLHLVDDEPIALGASRLPLALESCEWQARDLPPIYLLIESRLNLQIARADIAVRADAADAETAKQLRIPLHSPVLVMERHSFASDGRCCDHTLFHIRPERYEFILSTDRSSHPAGVRPRAVNADR
jgi:GntR family transcriptional regulator